VSQEATDLGQRVVFYTIYYYYYYLLLDHKGSTHYIYAHTVNNT